MLISVLFAVYSVWERMLFLWVLEEVFLRTMPWWVRSNILLSLVAMLAMKIISPKIEGVGSWWGGREEQQEGITMKRTQWWPYAWDFSWKFFLDQTKIFWDIDTVQANRVNCTETVEPIGALQRNGRSEGITLHCIYTELKVLTSPFGDVEKWNEQGAGIRYNWLSLTNWGHSPKPWFFFI